MQVLRCYEGVPPLKGQAKGFRRAWRRKQHSEENVNIGQNVCVNKSKPTIVTVFVMPTCVLVGKKNSIVVKLGNIFKRQNFIAHSINFFCYYYYYLLFFYSTMLNAMYLKK